MPEDVLAVVVEMIRTEQAAREKAARQSRR
jgi:hypothetical protein